MEGDGCKQWVLRTEVIDAIKKIQKHMVDMGAKLSSERYEKWTEIAQWYQRHLNRWPEEELGRWYHALSQGIKRDLHQLNTEKLQKGEQ